MERRSPDWHDLSQTIIAGLIRRRYGDELGEVPQEERKCTVKAGPGINLIKGVFPL